MQLSHRLLQLKCKAEKYQSRGYSLYPKEETFHSKLENIQRELNNPTQFKGNLLVSPLLIIVNFLK